MPNNFLADGFRGLGHPNKYLQADFAGVSRDTTPQWYLRLETLVPIETARLQDVMKWLGSSETTVIDTLVKYLLDHVPEPATEEGREDNLNAKRMIAGAFGRTFS